MSLAILLPSAHTSSPSSGGATTCGRIATTGETLIGHSNALMKALSTRRYSEIITIIQTQTSPDFRFLIDAYVLAASRSEYVLQIYELMRSAPKLFFHIQETEADVDEAEGKATVFQLSELTGLPDSARKFAISMMQWRRKPSGRWECYECWTIRGFGIVGGM